MEEGSAMKPEIRNPNDSERQNINDEKFLAQTAVEALIRRCDRLEHERDQAISQAAHLLLLGALIVGMRNVRDPCV
jgi:hypothetical protein